MLIFTYISIFLLLLFKNVVSSSTSSNIPFHAKENSNDWECNSGYYKTTPKEIALSTCKKCSQINKNDCVDDALFIPCTFLHDASCSQCPILSNRMVYTPNIHDCLTKRCQDGYYNNSLNLECISCPLNSYCLNGERNECGDQLITLNIEETSPLNCIPIQKSDIWQIHLTFSFSLKYFLPNEIISFCAYRREMVTSMLRYGNLIECNGNTVKNSDHDGELNCIILTTKRYAIDYIQWLDKEIETFFSMILMVTQECIQRNDITSLNVRILSSAPDSIYINDNTGTIGFNTSNYDMIIAPPLESPEFTHNERKNWKSDTVVVFVFTMTLLFVSICISIALIFTGLILRKRKREKQNNVHLNQKSFIVKGIIP